MAESELKFVVVCVFLMYGLHCTVGSEDPAECPPGTTGLSVQLSCFDSEPGPERKATCALNLNSGWLIGGIGARFSRIPVVSSTLVVISDNCASVTATNPPVATLPDSTNFCHASAILCLDRTERTAAAGGTSDSSESR